MWDLRSSVGQSRRKAEVELRAACVGTYGVPGSVWDDDDGGGAWWYKYVWWGSFPLSF